MSIISGELFFLFLFSFFFLSFKNDFSFSTIIVSVSRLLIYILPWHLDLNFIGIGRISLSVVRDQRRSNNESFQHFSSPNESEIISKTLLSAAERLSFKLQLLSGKQQHRHLFDHFLSLLGHDHSCPARKYISNEFTTKQRPLLVKWMAEQCRESFNDVLRLSFISFSLFSFTCSCHCSDCTCTARQFGV